MQSMNIPFLSSLGARRTNGGFGHRTTWAMWVVAVLLASIVIAVPVHRHVSAQSAASVSVTISNEDYETATATIAATGVTYDDWIMSVAYETEEYDPPNKSAGPGLSYTPQAAYTFDYTFDSNADTVDVTVTLDRLVPASDYTVTVTVYPEGEYNERVTGTANFTTKSGCYQDQGDYNPATDPALAANGTRPVWFGGHFSVSKREETEITLDVYVTNSGLAGVNEGRCIYYYYGARGGADRGPFSAYVYTKGGGRRAWIKLTELEMGTTYDFTISFHPRVQGRNVGTQVTTKGPRMAVRSVVVDRITLTDARATINVDNETGNSHAVYYRYFKTADTDDSNLHVTGNANTVTDPVVFNLPSLTAGTEYIAEASLEPSFPTNRTEFDIFPTKLNKPTGLGVTPGDGQLELGWTKPAGGDAIDEYIVQWKSGSETFDDAEADGRQETVAHVADTTTYDTTISSLLTNGTEYTVRVKAVNESGEAVSGEETGTPATIPEAPKELTVIPGNEMLTVSWEPLSISENGGADIIDYELQYSDDEGQTWSTFPPAMVVDGAQVYNAFIRSLQNGTTYDIRVRADNGVVLLDDQGNEDEGNYNWATDDGTPRPEPIVTEVTVADATVTQTEATATVTIENETDDGQTVHLQYRKTTESGWKTETPKTVVATATSETFNLRNLSGNTNYVVEAWLTTTSSIKESATFKTGPVEPDPPTNLKVTRTEDEEITVAWDAPADGGSEITGYKIQWKLYSQNNWNTYTQRDDDDGRSPYTINVNLENGEKYDIRVIAVNEVGDSGPSGEVTGAPSKKPDPPTDVEVSAHGDKWLEVTWTEPEDKGGLPTTYIVQWKSGADYSETDKADPATTPHKITNLKNGTQYTVRVLAKNERGTSDDPGDGSNEDTGTPMTKPQKPTDVSARFGDKSLTVSWTAPTGIEGTGGSAITGFKIQWKLNSEALWNASTYTEVDDDNGQSPYTINQGLTNGTKYDVRVLTVNGNTNTDDNTSAPSNSVTGRPSRKPNSPTGVDITEYGDGWLEVTWTALTGDATGGSPIKNYIVQWKSGANYDTTKQATPTESPHTITNLKNGTPYTVRLLAVNKTYPNDPSNDPGDGTNEDKETPRTKPKPPTEVNIKEYGDGILKVGWTAPEDNGGSALVSFKVQWKESSVSGWDSPDEKTVTAVSGKIDYETTISDDLDNGTEYTVRVLALNGNRPTDNTSDTSNTASGTPSTTPDAPTSVTITDEGDGTLTVTWEPPDEIGGLAITNYKVQWMGEDDTDWTSPANDKGASDRQHVITGLTNGEEYTVQVFAKNVNGYSTEYGQVTGIPSKKPDPPTDVEVSAHGDKWLEVTWTEPEDKGGLPTTYIVQWKSGADYSETDKADPATTPHKITNLKNGTQYTVRVLAKNERGTSDDPGDGSNEDTGTPMTKPQKPTDVSARFGDKSLTVSWTAPTGIEGTGGSPITGFKIQWKLNSEADWDTNTYTEIDDDDGQSPYTIEEVLTNGTMYDVRVLAVNDNDNVDDNTSDPSDAATGTPSRKPHKPTGVDITDHGDGWLEVTWTALTGDATGGSPIKNYIVQWKSGANYDTTNQGTPTVSPYKITNLENGTPYTVRVLGVNEANPDTSGDPSDEVTETPRTIPGPPTELGVISGDKELTVSWTAPVPEKNGGAGINQFVVQWKSGDQDYDTSRQETTSNTSQVIKPLTNGTPYSIQVRADNGEEPEGEQEYNWEETTGTPMTVPGAPTNLEVEEGDRQLKVSWVAPTNTGGLNIKIDHFVIQWQVKGGNWSSPRDHTTTDETVLTDTITGLLNGTDYDIRVRADNDVEGQTFEWAYTTGKPRKIPSAPRSLRVEAGDGQLALSWAAPSNKGGLDINQYIVQWKSGIQEYDTSRQATPTITSQVIGQLTNGTPHFVRVRADNGEEADSYNWATGNGTPAAAQSLPPPPQQNNPPPQRSPVNPTPPVIKSPEVSSVIFADILQTSANATVKIMYAGTSQKTVSLHYRVDGATAWSTPPKSDKTSGSSKTFTLSDLTAGTTYEVQAWLNNNLPPAGTKIYEFDTLDEQASAPDAAISNLKCENIGQTSATAMVEIANAGTDMKEVFLKHSMDGTEEWSQLPFPTVTYTDSTSIDLTGLQEGTTYQVAVALSEGFSGMVIESCTTLLLDPVVSGISVDRRKQTSVWANVSIANANGEDQTVHLRYRTTTPQGEWSDSAKTTTSTDSASKEIAGLTADTEYEVQASLDSTFPDELTKNTTFTTLRFPSISNLEVEDETKNSATAVITIADPDGSSQTIHLRYRTTTPQGVWSGILETTSTTAEASLGLTGLAPDTEYEAEVSLTSDFAVAVSDVFRTLPPDPVVSKVSVNSIRQTTATASIDIANANGSTHTVSLRYRTTTPRGDWIDDLKTTSDTETASKELSGLTAGTEYDVQASLDDSFPATRTKSATFTTLRWPSIASFEVENVGRNGATVNATIADSRGVAQTVHVRHRATGYIAWRPTQQVDSIDDIASLRLRGLSSGTEYATEASLNESFPSDETESVTFTTVKRKDDDDASSSGSGTVQAARAENIPLLGFSPQMLRFVAIEGGDNPAPQTFSVWNRAQGSMSFNLSNHEEWLSQQPMSGVSNGPDDPVTITASVDSVELASGQYVDVINIEVTSAGKSPGQVIVVLDVLPPDYIRQFVSRDEGGIVVLPDGTVRLVVPPGSPPKDVDIELMKLNTEAHGEPLRDSERVVLALDSNTYSPGGDTPEDVAYSPAAELWLRLPSNDRTACDEGKTRVYFVEAETWSLVEHRCETDESGHAWAVTQVERLGQFALVIDDAPVVATPTPVAAAVAPTPTAIPASAPAVAVQRVSLPAQPPTPTPTQIPTPMPLPNGKRASVQTIGPAPTQTAVPAATESLAQTLQASSEDGDSGSFGSIVFAAIGAPLIIGLFIVGYLAYRERRRTGNPNL